MKVYVQIGTSKEKVDFELKLSDTIKTLKARIAEDRGIPVCIQRLFHKYQEDLEDTKKCGIRDEIKLSQIIKMNETFENEIYSSKKDESKAKVSKKEYLRLYLYGYLKIKVRTFGGDEISFAYYQLGHLNIGQLKSSIFNSTEYPDTLQKLYLGDASMTELNDREYILSPQIIEKVCDYGLILKVAGKIPLRNIARGADTKVYYPEIDAMDTIANIKKQISRQNLCKPVDRLYIDGNDIQNLKDEKRLCDYDLSEILSFGLLMKPKPMRILASFNCENHSIECDPGDTVAGLRYKVLRKFKLPANMFSLHFGGFRLENLPVGTTLKDHKIVNDSTIHVIGKLLGD